MLRFESRFKKSVLRSLAFLLIIPFISFYPVYAKEAKEAQNTSGDDIKGPTAEEYHIKGYEEQQKGNLDNALFYYNKAIAMGLENAAILNDMGILSEQMGFPKEAEKFYLKAQYHDPEYLATYSNLAYLYLNNGQKGKAAKYFKLRYKLSDPSDPWAQIAKEELIKIHPDNKQWIIAIESERINEELSEKAKEEFYKEVSDIKTRTNEHYDLGNKLSEEGKLKEALSEYEQACELSPLEVEICEAKQKTKFKIFINDINERWGKVNDFLNAGDNIAAKIELQKMLTIIPDEPIIKSK